MSSQYSSRCIPNMRFTVNASVVKMFARLKKYFFTSPTPSEKLDLRAILKPLHVTLSLLGLFPYSIQFQNNKHFVIIPKFIYINTICAVSVILTICSFLALHINYLYIRYEDNSLTDGIMTEFNYVVELVGIFMVCIVAYVCSFLNRYNFVQMLNTIAKYLEPSNDCNDKELKHLRMKINIIMGSLLLALVMQICVNFTRNDSFWKMILVTFSFILPQMVQFLMLAFYYVLVNLVVALLNIIKHHVLSCTKQKKMMNFVKVEPRVTMTLQQMERIYVKAFEVKRKVNSAFQAPILVTTIQCFHAMVSESHIIFHGVVVHGDLSYHEIINCSIWILYQVIKVYVLANAGNSLKVEIAKLGQALHNIPTQGNDTRLMAEIQHFSTLISYQGNALSVYGFFPLDATLMFKVIASAAMYLIILVQFDKRN